MRLMRFFSYLQYRIDEFTNKKHVIAHFNTSNYIREVYVRTRRLCPRLVHIEYVISSFKLYFTEIGECVGLVYI